MCLFSTRNFLQRNTQSIKRSTGGLHIRTKWCPEFQARTWSSTAVSNFDSGKIAPAFVATLQGVVGAMHFSVGTSPNLHLRSLSVITSWTCVTLSKKTNRTRARIINRWCFVRPFTASAGLSNCGSGLHDLWGHLRGPLLFVAQKSARSKGARSGTCRIAGVGCGSSIIHPRCRKRYYGS